MTSLLPELHNQLAKDTTRVIRQAKLEKLLKELCNVKTWEGIRGNPKMQANAIFESYARRIEELFE